MFPVKDELIECVRRGDLHGLNFAGLVRLSFEPNYSQKKDRPHELMNGADINGRENQDELCRRYIESRGGRYVYPYDEPDTSAWKRRRVTNPDGSYRWEVVRPVFDGMIADLKAGHAPNGERIDGIVAYDLDRLTRDHRHLEDAIDVANHYAKAFIDISGTLDLLTQSGQDNARILVTMKGRQSADTSKRITDKHYAIARAGIPVGGSRPFGWNDDKRTLHPVESELIRKARVEVLSGVGLHTICREWQKAGVKTPRGNNVVRPVLRNLLLSPRLAGYRVYRGEICLDYDGNKVMGQYEPVLTVGEWEELRDYLTREGRQGRGVHKGGRKYLLSGIARCAVCGAALCGGWDNRWNNFNYSCPAPTVGGCGKVAINGPKLDALITELIFAYLADKTVQPEAEPWPRAAELVAKEAKVRELMAAYHDDQLPKELVFPEVARLNGEIAELKRDRTHWNREQRRATKASSSVVDVWPGMEIDRQQAVVESLIHTFVIKPRISPQARFQPARADVVWR